MCFSLFHFGAVINSIYVGVLRDCTQSLIQIGQVLQLCEHFSKLISQLVQPWEHFWKFGKLQQNAVQKNGCNRILDSLKKA